jgi:hypothetical protein
MNKQTGLLVLAALILGLAPGCGGSESPSEASKSTSPSTDLRDDIYLRFTIDGDGFSSERFEPVFGNDTRARNVNYWMGHKDRELTTFRMETSGDSRLDINFKIDAEALGTYQFEPDDLNMNQNFDLNLRNPDWEKRRQYLAQQATLELNDYDGEYISGTFSGRFFRGSRTNQDDRIYVTISDGEFRVNWAEGQSSKNKDRW